VIAGALFYLYTFCFAACIIPHKEEIMVPAPLIWIAAALVWMLSCWTIVAAIVEVVRKKSKPWHKDVVAAILFHGGTAIAVLKLASWAMHVS